MIKPMDISETNEIMDLWLRTSNYSNSFVEAEFWENHYDFVKEKYLDGKAAYVYVDEGRIVGFTVIGAGNEIGGLFVDPEYQNRGIGTELIRFLRSDYKLLRAKIYARNRKALAFSVKLGFVIEGAERHAGNNEVMYCMLWN